MIGRAGAGVVRRTADAGERTDLWRCRKKAFGAVGRLTPNYVTMDVVVPLGRLPEMVRAVGRITAENEVRIATAFHAGDGNLHPGVHFDEHDPASKRRAHRAADAIMVEALRLGGSLTGEHGVGLEKLHVVGRQIDKTSAGLMHDICRLFDPDYICNPDKALPRLSDESSEVPPVPTEVDFRWDSLTVTAPADTDLAVIQTRALDRGFWIPVGAVLPRRENPGLGTAGTVGEMIDHLVGGPSLLGCGTVRDYLLEVWAETGDGRLFHAGAPVVKDVAGFDLTRLLCGSAGMLARLRGATFQLKPVPECAALWQLQTAGVGPDDEALAELCRELAGWGDDLAAPVCIADGFEVGARGVVLLAAGRERSWDLGQKEEAVSRWAARSGLVLQTRERFPFRGVRELGEHPALPAWACRCRDWTFLARRPGSRGLLPGLAAGRMVWQGAPPLLWVPQAAWEPDPSWHADTWCRAGRVTWPGAPDRSVPGHLLAGLKEIFDPAGLLGEPDWLAEQREEAP